MSNDQGQPEFSRVWLGLSRPHEGLIEALREDGAEVLDLPEDKPWEAPEQGDLVLLSVDWKPENAFLLCSRLKAPRKPWVCVVMMYETETEGELAEPLTQFCMADGLLHLDPEQETGHKAALELLFSVLHRPRLRVSTDVLLARLEGEMRGAATELADRIQSELSSERGRSFLHSVTDPETGLYSRGFMAFKLEEEFKRSWRFRLPLSVLLLDFPAMREIDADERLGILGQVSGLLLTECRDIDFMGRYDESSFLLLLPNTGLFGAKVFTTRILTSIQELDHVALAHPAIAMTTVPKASIETKDDLLDLLRMTLVSAWSAEGSERVQIAD